MRDSAMVVSVHGELDLATAPRLEEELTTRTPGKHLVIDLTGCTFLDSSGVRVLALTASALSEEEGRLAVVASDAGIVRVLEITGIDTLIDVHSSLDTAL
jgi:anti-sigma B factor antagonist